MSPHVKIEKSTVRDVVANHTEMITRRNEATTVDNTVL